MTEPAAEIRRLPPRPRLTLRSRDVDFFEKQAQSAGVVETLPALEPEGLRTDAQKAVRRDRPAPQSARAAGGESRPAPARRLAERTFLVVVPRTSSAPTASSAS
ncbi:hypothetical protein GCM10022384_22620 [Streptomyces marokkonensis]|uniref:Uncharacterized protein n=1 Tax=Streptomyces marokkonensis TaxID=324855 RepID=A0ABP7PTP5_9ACTN